MSDQGEKIIHLAREFLRSGHLNAEENGNTPAPEHNNSITFKAAALAAFLAASGSATITHLIEDTRRPMNRYERVEISALVMYAAKQKSVTEQSITHEMMNSLSIESLPDMSVYDYRRARDYLRDKAS